MIVFLPLSDSPPVLSLKGTLLQPPAACMSRRFPEYIFGLGTADSLAKAYPLEHLIKKGPERAKKEASINQDPYSSVCRRGVWHPCGFFHG